MQLITEILKQISQLKFELEYFLKFLRHGLSDYKVNKDYDEYIIIIEFKLM
jgi:hypothetical protein